MACFSPRVVTTLPVMTLPQHPSEKRYSFDDMDDCPGLEQSFQMASVTMGTQPTDRFVVIIQGYSPEDKFYQRDLPSNCRHDSVVDSDTSSALTLSSKVNKFFSKCKDRLSRLSTSSTSSETSCRSLYRRYSSGSIASPSSSEDMSSRRSSISILNNSGSSSSTYTSSSQYTSSRCSDASCTSRNSRSSSGSFKVAGSSSSSKGLGQHSRVVLSAKALAAEMQHLQEALVAMTAFSNWCGVPGSVKM